MNKYLARFFLALIAAAVLVGIYIPTPHVDSRLWPITTHHPHLLLFFGVAIGWMVIIIGLLFGIMGFVALLWKWAWDDTPQRDKL